MSHVLWAQIGSTRLESDVKKDAVSIMVCVSAYRGELLELQPVIFDAPSVHAWRDDGKRDCSRRPLPTGIRVAEVIHESLSWSTYQSEERKERKCFKRSLFE